MRADSISADQGGAAREAAVARFRSGATWVLVATGTRPRPPRCRRASSPSPLTTCDVAEALCRFASQALGMGLRLREERMPRSCGEPQYRRQRAHTTPRTAATLAKLRRPTLALGCAGRGPAMPVGHDGLVARGMDPARMLLPLGTDRFGPGVRARPHAGRVLQGGEGACASKAARVQGRPCMSMPGG